MNESSEVKNLELLHKISLTLLKTFILLDPSKLPHSFGNLKKSCPVGTLLESTILSRSAFHLLVDVGHHILEFVVNFVTGPSQTLGILTHFQSTHTNASGVAGFSWDVNHVTLFPEDLLGLYVGG
jgi:hypothetical protein